MDNGHCVSVRVIKQRTVIVAWAYTTLSDSLVVIQEHVFFFLNTSNNNMNPLWFRYGVKLSTLRGNTTHGN